MRVTMHTSKVWICGMVSQWIWRYVAHDSRSYQADSDVLCSGTIQTL